MKALLELLILLGAVLAFTHWGTFALASNVDADEFQKLFAASPVVIVFAIYQAWAKRNKRTAPASKTNHSDRIRFP